MAYDIALDYAVRSELWLEGADYPTRDWRYPVWCQALGDALGASRPHTPPE